MLRRFLSAVAAPTAARTFHATPVALGKSDFAAFFEQFFQQRGKATRITANDNRVLPCQPLKTVMGSCHGSSNKKKKIPLGVLKPQDVDTTDPSVQSARFDCPPNTAARRAPQERSSPSRRIWILWKCQWLACPILWPLPKYLL